MAKVNIVNIDVLDNDPSTSFLNPFQFEITFEAQSPLDDDLEWKVVYVGSAESQEHDQELDNVAVGPVPVGINKFILQTDAPDPSKIPSGDLLGVTVILIMCSYKGQEFVRVGYYVNNMLPGVEGGEEEAGEEIDGDEEEGEEEEEGGAGGSGGSGGERKSSAGSGERVDPAKVVRSILADKPRVTRFPIDWN